MAIERARREKGSLRFGLAGPQKHGKSFTALMIARGLIEKLTELGQLHGNGRIGVIDTERHSSKRYAMAHDKDFRRDAFDFDVINFNKPPFSPEEYIKKIAEFEAEDYSVIIIDQISHEWDGIGGVLQICQEIVKNSNGKKNSFTAWMEATPRHQALVNRWNDSEAHFICTMRAKVKHKIVDKVPIKIGFKPIARNTTEYEFDAFGMMTKENGVVGLRFEGVREGLTRTLGDQVFLNPDEKIGHIFAEMLCFGQASTVAEQGTLDPGTVKILSDLMKQARFTNDEIVESLTGYGVSRVTELSIRDADKIIKSLKNMLKQEKLQQQAVQVVAEEIAETVRDQMNDDNLEINFSKSLPPSQPKTAKRKDLTITEVRDDVMAAFEASSKLPVTLQQAIPDMGDQMGDVADEEEQDSEGPDYSGYGDHVWAALRDRASELAGELADKFGFSEDAWDNQVSIIMDSSDSTADDMTIDQLETLIGYLEGCKNEQEQRASIEDDPVEEEAGFEENIIEITELTKDEILESLRDQASELAEYIGYDKKTWLKHVKSKAKGAKSTDDLNREQLDSLIEDLEAIRADKDTSGKAFKLSDWEF